ncbi:50S ribosomal protein L4 [Candidatus Micrarchaeota archaeon]|nr:50S ribosomal protein L4 [Candidatus Micrarchaeota archaeon]
MKANVLKVDGTANGSVELPSQFSTPYRPDVIRRAFWAFSSLRWQPKGAFPLAGMQNTAEYYGRRHAWRQTINTGRSRLPREKVSGGRSGRVLRVPHAVKGRRAHPPKPEKVLVEKINAKEKNLALRSAIAATANAQIVESHGHVLGAKTQLPIVAESSLENAGKTSDVRKFLVSVGLEKELQKASVSRTPLSGVAGRRSGGHAQKKSVLIIYGTPGAAISKAGRNLAGVDCASVDELNAALLAPGGSAGRLCVWTQGALDKLAKENLYL